MELNIKDIQPLNGYMNCYLFENPHNDLPLRLYYMVEIPIHPFNTGHEYVNQPFSTKFIIDWIIFNDEKNRVQERNWKNLVGKTFNLSYENQNAEGTIYLGTEHCQLNTEMHFLSLSETTFDVELKMDINFNIKTKNLDSDKRVKIKTQVDFEGLKVCHNKLPTFQKAISKMALTKKFVDLSVYQTEFRDFKTKHDNCKFLDVMP